MALPATKRRNMPAMQLLVVGVILYSWTWREVGEILKKEVTVPGLSLLNETKSPRPFSFKLSEMIGRLLSPPIESQN